MDHHFQVPFETMERISLASVNLANVHEAGKEVPY